MTINHDRRQTVDDTADVRELVQQVTADVRLTAASDGPIVTEIRTATSSWMDSRDVLLSARAVLDAALDDLDEHDAAIEAAFLASLGPGELPPAA